jgi:putative addiction module component (TIGR02574 family)
MYTVGMSVKLPLDKMTIQEKLAAMESLWDDLSRSPKAIESPEWHKEILDQRSKRIAEGTGQFVDWEAAKASIREKLR